MNRREFLKLTGKIGALGAAGALGLDALSMARAAAAAEPDDYRALVLVFLYGGNDAYNTLVPLDEASHGRYLKVRPEVAIDRSAVEPYEIMPDAGYDHDRRVGLNPALAPLHPLWNDGRLSVVANLGTLYAPTTLDDYRAGRNLPPKLMSHNDQFALWQTLELEGATSGWGGRLGDLAAADVNGANELLSLISIDSSSLFLDGSAGSGLTFGSAGPNFIDELEILPGALVDLIQRRLSTAGGEHLIQDQIVERYNRTVAGGTTMASALNSVGNLMDPTSPIGSQLAMVARLIKASAESLAMKRQVFFVSMGGYDSHGSLGEVHNGLLAELGTALAGFQGALDGNGLADRVVTFTGSDFGRSLTSNGRGSDHGWGGHHFVLSGEVKPRTVTGVLPTVELGGPDDIGQGRLLPSVGLEQYGATMARWFGLTEADLPAVFPHLNRFPTADLGFLV